MCSLECQGIGQGYGSYRDYRNAIARRGNRRNSIINPYLQKHYEESQKVGFWEGVKSFGKGLLKPIANIIEHPFKSILGIGACAALIIGTGGAATPLLIGAGVALGGWQLGKGTYNFFASDTREETLAALEDAGEGVFTVAASAYGAKAYMSTTTAGSATAAAANKTGVIAKTSTYLKGLGQDTLATLKTIPTSAKQTASTILSNEFVANLKPSVNAVKLDIANKKIQQMVIDGKAGTPEYNALLAKRDNIANFLRDYGDGNVCKSAMGLRNKLAPWHNKAETNLAIGLNSYLPDDREVLGTAQYLCPEGIDYISQFA